MEHVILDTWKESVINKTYRRSWNHVQILTNSGRDGSRNTYHGYVRGKGTSFLTISGDDAER